LRIDWLALPLLSGFVLHRAGMAAETLVPARVLVPVSADQIGEVKLGGKHYDVLSMTGAASVPAIVVAFARFGQPGHDVTLYSEIGSIITRSTVEIWGSGWSANLVGGQFPEGWVAAIEDHPSTDRLFGLPQPEYEDIFERIAQRFAGRGPVRVFWINRRLGWFDARAKEDHFVSPLEDLFPLTGDSGLTLYPLYIPDQARLKTGVRKQYEWVAWMFGSNLRIVRGAPGESLLRAIQESDQGTVLDLKLPRMHHTLRGLPPKLEVLDRSRQRILYSRPLIVGGTTSTVPPNTFVGLEKRLYRIVPRLVFEKAQTTLSCGGRTTLPPESLVRIEGLKTPCPSGTCRTTASTIVTPERTIDRGLSRRYEDIVYEQRGATACVGPLQIKEGTKVLLYSAESNWLASFEFR
jgi:hypothetical protein